MKILLFSHMPEFSSYKYHYPGGSWIAMLAKGLTEAGHEVGLVGFSKESFFAFENGNIKLYSLISQRNNPVSRLFYNITHSITESTNINEYKKIIEDFGPAIIQIFGTESEHALNVYALQIQIPTIIHIQGLANPCFLTWSKASVSNPYIFFKSKILKTIRGSGFFHDYYRFKKIAEREKIILSKTKHLMGRTLWDKSVAAVLAPNANYYHCDEIMRDEFQNSKWEFQSRSEIIISTVINENIYKGIDTIFETVNILEELNVNYRWNIIGIKTNSQLVDLFKFKLKSKKHLSKLNFTGIKQSNEIVDILLNSSVFVHTSHIDNSSNSVCEAMQLGIPVISSNVGGINSLIEDGKTGLLFSDGDAYRLVSLIQSINKQDIASHISKNAREISLIRHNSTRIVGDLMKIFKIVINE